MPQIKIKNIKDELPDAHSEIVQRSHVYAGVLKM